MNAGGLGRVMKEHLEELLRAALRAVAARADGRAELAEAAIQLERPRDEGHGDWATNLALALAKRVGMPPRELAERIIAALPESPEVAGAEVAGPGFINFRLSGAAHAGVVAEALRQGRDFGRSAAAGAAGEADLGGKAGARGNKVSARGNKVLVEFVSANPTGPLHIGHGRGAAVGDCIARLLEATGWEVAREFYYNDGGGQIDHLARSVQARCKGAAPGDAGWPEDGYRGEYIGDIAAAYLAAAAVEAEDRRITAAGDPDDLDAIRQFAVAYLRREQDLDLKAFGVRFDRFFLESSLYESGEVDDVVRRLRDGGHAFAQDGALWLRTTAFGDDKDRVMRKRDGGYTYFLPDIAYHYNKWRRGFRRAIDEQGADHHGTVARVRAGLQALAAGIPEGWPDYVLHQMVTVTRGGEEVRISKRAGGYVTLREVIDEVGRDAARYFLAARSPDSQLTFDIDLARARSNDNPVYYIQYAHARACSVMRKLKEQGLDWSPGMYLDASGADAAAPAAAAHLQADAERSLMRRLARYPELVALAAERAEPHAIAHYLRELAGDFHSWYNACRVIADDAALRNARLALSEAARLVLANGLDLLGVSAPEAM